MKKTVIAYLLIFICYSASSQTIDIPTYGTDSTLDIMTWNIEHFPKNGQTTLDYVKQIIQQLDVDIISFQEISDTALFKQMLADLPGYNYYFKSSWYAGLAYAYKSSVIQINNTYEIYTTSPYWSPFPRSPMVMDLSFKGENFILINNHFKCCGDGILDLSNTNDEENRRYVASNLLRDYINSNFPDKKVLVVGDMNDEISDLPPNNVFQNIISDTANFLFTDMNIANGSSSGWSYPTYPSHLDHILITNELFDEFNNVNSGVKTVKIDEFLTNGWSEYDANVSDHRPVAIKLKTNSGTGINDVIAFNVIFSNYPNPFNEKTVFCFQATNCNSILEIYNSNGQEVKSIDVIAGQCSVAINFNDLQRGVYFAKLVSNGVLNAVCKVICLK